MTGGTMTTLRLDVVYDDGTQGTADVAVGLDGKWRYTVPDNVLMVCHAFVNPGDTVSGGIEVSRW